jgi:hypothetical protein
VHGLQKLFRGALLAEETVRAGAQHVDAVLALGKTAQDEDPRVREPGAHVLEDVEAAAIRHRDVEDQEVPLAIAQPVQRLLPGLRFADLADGVVRAQELPQSGTHDGMIVRNQYPGHPDAPVMADIS